VIVTLPLLPLHLLGRVDETKISSGMSFGIKIINARLLLRHLGGDVETMIKDIESGTI
jgi:hypothetical protein